MQTDNVRQIVSALQNWPTNQQVAVDQVRAVADSGDPVAASVAAYLLGPQMARWAEGLPYVEAAIAAGVTYPAYVYGQNLLTQGDASLRGHAITFMRAALDDGWPADPFGPLMTVGSQGDIPTTERLLDLATQPRPSGARQRWEELVADVAARRSEIDNVVAVVRGERERVTADIVSDREAVAAQRRSVEELAAQVGVLANRTAGDAIAEDYARRAGQVEKTARRYTWASIGLALLIAVGATFATILIDGGEFIDDAASKAAVAIPLVALNLYLGRLAAQYRQEAVELRHIELQFNTANPFLSALDDDRRKEVLAQLAQKFFPGQALPGGGESAATQPDIAQLVAATLVERLSPASPQRPPDPATSPDQAG